MLGKGFWAVAAACLALTAVVIGGCGGSDSSTSSSAVAATSEGANSESASSAPLTKQQFAAQANQICQERLKEKDEAAETALKELPPQALKNPTPKTLAFFVEQAVLPTYRTLIGELKQLSAPKGDEATVEKIMTKYEASLKIAEAQPEKTAANDLFLHANNTARAYGLALCRL